VISDGDAPTPRAQRKEKGGQIEVARRSTSKLAEMGRNMLRPYKETKRKEKAGS
jgi:hypothetical protein